MNKMQRAARWCLRLTVVAQCAGLVALYYGHRNETESDIYGVLYFDWQWTESTAQWTDDAGVLMCGVCAAWVLVAGLLQPTSIAAHAGQAPSAGRLRRWPVRIADLLALALIFGWFLTLAAAHLIHGGPYTQWALAEHAVRYAAPLALILVGPLAAWWRFPAAAADVAWMLLRIAAAATFVAHGYKAMQGYGPFVDLILLTDLRWSGAGIQQPTVETMLAIIGWIDLSVAVVVLSPWWRAAAAYMAVWGAVTASSRITGLSLEAWPETLLRAANCGVPLALVWWSRRSAGEIPGEKQTVETSK